MRMDRMVEYLENRGFKATKRYLKSESLYEFDVLKDGITVKGYFRYPDAANSMDAVNRAQLDFLDGVIRDWSRRADTLKRYCDTDIALTTNIAKTMLNSVYGAKSAYRACVYIPAIKNVIFNNPATIVFWTDGTKTVVKCDEKDLYDPEKGLAMAISKKAFGNNYPYYNVFKKWLKRYDGPTLEQNSAYSVEITEAGAIFKRLGDALRSMTPVKIVSVPCTKHEPDDEPDPNYDIGDDWDGEDWA